MKTKISILLLSFCVLGFSNSLLAQGCIAIRSTGGVCSMNHAALEDTSSKWEFNMNNRYFKSFRHFSGTTQEKQRVALGTDVINHQYTADLTPTFHLNKWWSFSLDVPILSNSRSSLYEHDGVHRYVTHSFGLGDIRLTAYRWMTDPSKMPKGNISSALALSYLPGTITSRIYFTKLIPLLSWDRWTSPFNWATAELVLPEK